jgi:predicted RNase H-like nuclease (RuvC/YqgF family)
MDPIFLCIKASFDKLTGDFITAQNFMATAMNANQEMMEDKMKMVLGELSSFKEANAILAQELEASSEALTNSGDLLEASHEKVKELESVVAKQKDEIERLLIRIDSSSEDNQLVRSSNKTVNTASQTSENTDHHSLQPTDAAEKIRKLEDELWNKTKYVTKLKNKLTRQRLRTKKISGRKITRHLTWRKTQMRSDKGQ